MTILIRDVQPHEFPKVSHLSVNVDQRSDTFPSQTVTSLFWSTISGYIHFSHRHIQEAFRSGEGANVQIVIGPTDFDREPEHLREPMPCMHHLNLIAEFALQDWFKRKCDPNGVTVSAKELWAEPDDEASD